MGATSVRYYALPAAMRPTARDSDSALCHFSPYLPSTVAQQPATTQQRHRLHPKHQQLQVSHYKPQVHRHPNIIPTEIVLRLHGTSSFIQVSGPWRVYLHCFCFRLLCSMAIFLSRCAHTGSPIQLPAGPSKAKGCMGRALGAVPNSAQS